MKKIAALTLMTLTAFLPTMQAQESDDAKVKAVMEEAYAAAAKKDEAELKRIGEQLRLEQPDVWFAGQFGDEKGAKLAASYADLDFSAEFPKMLLNLAEKGLSKIEVTAIKDKADPNANGNQRDALAAMKNPIVLYSVRFKEPNGDGQYHLYSFAVIDGKVRFLYKLNG